MTTTPFSDCTWQSLSLDEQNNVSLRLSYLHALLYNTYLLDSNTNLDIIVSRELAAVELRLLGRLNVPEQVIADSKLKLEQNRDYWLQLVRNSTRTYALGFTPPLCPEQGMSPPCVVDELNQHISKLFEGLCGGATYLIGYGRKRLHAFAKEQAQLGLQPCITELAEQMKLTRKQKKVGGPDSAELRSYVDSPDDFIEYSDELSFYAQMQIEHQKQRVHHINTLLEGKFDKHLANIKKGLGTVTSDGLFKRCCDSMYIYKALRKITRRAREALFLRLGLIGHDGEKYSSTRITREHLESLESIEKWMRNTGLEPANLLTGCPDNTDSASTKGVLTLADCAKTATHRFAKMYTFINAIETISREAGLAVGMLTITMPPRYHPNPKNGFRTWDGTFPDKTNRDLATAWKLVLQKLDRRKIGITGFRVVEPHQDSCPHWHLWLNYQPRHEKEILSAVMSEFPGQLKIRGRSGTVIYNDVSDYVAQIDAPDVDVKSSTRLDFAVIDRSISSGATYLMKYLLKNMNVKAIDRNGLPTESLDLFDDHLVSQPVDPSVSSQLTFADARITPKERQAHCMERSELCPLHPSPEKESVRRHFDNAERIEAARRGWSIRSFDLFGLARCLGVWDVLRKLTKKPSNQHLAKLWILARGTEQEGRITAGSKTQGNAVEFIRALGCMRAVSFEPEAAYIKVGLLKAPKQNNYREDIHEVIGLRLFDVKKQHVLSTVINHETGEVKQRRRLKWVKTEITSLVTKNKRWLLKKTVEARQEVLHSVQTPAASDFNLAVHELSTDGACQSEIDWLMGKVDAATSNANHGPPQQELDLACECV